MKSNLLSLSQVLFTFPNVPTSCLHPLCTGARKNHAASSSSHVCAYSVFSVTMQVYFLVFLISKNHFFLTSLFSF